MGSGVGKGGALRGVHARAELVGHFEDAADVLGRNKVLRNLDARDLVVHLVQAACVHKPTGPT